MLTPDQIKLLVIAAIAAALLAGGAIGGWVVNGWRLGKDIERLEGDKRTLEDQVKVIADAANACSAGVASGKQLGDQVAGEIRGALKGLVQQNAGNAAAVGRLEDLLKKPTPAGAGCDKAWDAIEADRKARAP